MTNPDQWLIVGKLVGVQGLQGQIRINPESDFPERFTKPGYRWLQKKGEKPRKIKLLRGRQLPGKCIYVVTFAGIENRNDAKAIVGDSLLVPANERPVLSDNQFHLLDLVGLEVRIQPDKPPIGKVTNLITAGNDLLEIMLLNGRSVLIPFVDAIVPKVHLKDGWLLITPPPGLLEL